MYKSRDKLFEEFWLAVQMVLATTAAGWRVFGQYGDVNDETEAVNVNSLRFQMFGLCQLATQDARV